MKQRIVEASGDGTIRTRVFDIVRCLDWPEPYTARVIANAFSAAWHGREAELTAQLRQESERYEAARKAGDPGTAALFAGEGVDMIDACRPAGEVIARIVDEAEALLPSSTR